MISMRARNSLAARDNVSAAIPGLTWEALTQGGREVSRIRSRWWAFAAIAAVFALAFGLGSAPSANAATATYFRIKNFHTGSCLAEKGTSGAVYLASCTSNHSNYWTFSASQSRATPMVNLHSGHCLNVYGTAGYVNAIGCDGNHAQYWYEGAVTGYGVEIVNYHSGLCLWWNGSHIVQLACRTSNHADLWYNG